MLLRDLLKQAAARIGREDAEHLLLALLNKPRSWLYSHDDAQVDAADDARFAQWLARRESGEPVAYITGRRGFWTFELTVSPATLIPRPETEHLVELALARLPEGVPLMLADLGTGSGAIALALALERPCAQVMAVDASPAALAVAEHNARALGLANLHGHLGDWLAPLAGQRFDLIASNPPYIEAEDPHLAEGDVRFEPRSALIAGADGLDDLRRIVQAAPACLKPGGWLLLEHGWQQGHAVRTLLAEAGFSRVETAQDLEERDRVSLGQWP